MTGQRPYCQLPCFVLSLQVFDPTEVITEALKVRAIEQPMLTAVVSSTEHALWFDTWEELRKHVIGIVASRKKLFN